MTHFEAQQACLAELELAASAGDYHAKVQLDKHKERTRIL